MAPETAEVAHVTATDPNEEQHPNASAAGHLRAARAEFAALATEAGRSDAGRLYHIIVTDLEKLIHIEKGYFPRR